MKNIFRWLLKALGCIVGLVILAVIGVGLAFLWLQSQLYSATPLRIPVPNISSAPDLQESLLSTGKIQLSGPELAQILWIDKPPELEALAIEITPTEQAEPSLHIQTSLRVNDSEQPYLNIDAQLSFLYENNSFLNTQVHNCKLGKLDLTRWCKGYDLNDALTEGIREQAATDIVLQSTLGLIKRAYLNENSLVIEINQQDLLRSVLEQLNTFDPNLIQELQGLDLNIALE